MSKNDGGPAFPGEKIVWDKPNNPTKEIARIPVAGMSLRAWFAGQALAGMQIVPDFSKGSCNRAIVERAFTIADLCLQKVRSDES